ncbi:MAG: O-antigen ligase family protein [Candidatus Omnitrophica bacterium]|nr:O-antigen ligase family protein [Candidatus Omnitrophota bacterium]
MQFLKDASGIKSAGFGLALIGSAFSISVCGVGLAVYLAGVLIELFSAREYDWRPFPHLKFLIPLLGCLIVSMAISDYFMVSARGLFKYVEGFILLYAGLDVIRNSRMLRRLVFLYLVCYTLALLAALAQEIYGLDFVYFRPAIAFQGDVYRLTGPFKHSNDFGSFLVPGFGILCAVILEAVWSRRRWRAVLAAVLFVLASYCLARTLSRSALLSVMLSLFVFGLFFRFRWKMTAVLILVLVCLAVIPSPVSQRMREIANPASGNNRERVLLIGTAVRMIRQSPVFGLGLNTYSDYFPEFRPADYDTIMYAHNSYLQIATESGLVGISFYLLFLLVLLGSFCRGIAKSPPTPARTLGIGLAAGITGLMFNALFESLLQSTRIRTLFWCLMGMSAALVYMQYFKAGKDAGS